MIDYDLRNIYILTNILLYLIILKKDLMTYYNNLYKLFKHCINMKLIKNVQSWGNSAGVLLPKNWQGKRVQITLIDRTLEIKKEVFSILDPYLEEIIGIYICGSYSRGDEDDSSDIDIIAISNGLKKDIISGKYRVSIIPLSMIKSSIEKDPIQIFPRIKEAKTLLNDSLIKGLKNQKIRKDSFKKYFEDTLSIIKIDEDIINLDKNDMLDSAEIIYSLILRARGIFLIKNILQNENYSKKKFLRYIEKDITKENVDRLYNIYREYKEKQTSEIKIKTEIVLKLLYFIKKEVKDLK